MTSVASDAIRSPWIPQREAKVVNYIGSGRLLTTPSNLWLALAMPEQAVLTNGLFRLKNVQRLVVSQFPPKGVALRDKPTNVGACRSIKRMRTERMAIQRLLKNEVVVLEWADVYRDFMVSVC